MTSIYIDIIEKDNFELTDELNLLESKLWSYSNNTEISIETIANLENQAWVNDVEWDWVEIVLNWEVNWSHLRDLVNVLRGVQVKAIAIWNQRVIYSTPIIDLSNAILVWNTRFRSPITINVIWDYKRIKSKIELSELMKDAIWDDATNWVELELVEKNVKIPRI